MNDLSVRKKRDLEDFQRSSWPLLCQTFGTTCCRPDGARVQGARVERPSRRFEFEAAEGEDLGIDSFLSSGTICEQWLNGHSQ